VPRGFDKLNLRMVIAAWLVSFLTNRGGARPVPRGFDKLNLRVVIAADSAGRPGTTPATQTQIRRADRAGEPTRRDGVGQHLVYVVKLY